MVSIQDALLWALAQGTRRPYPVFRSSPLPHVVLVAVEVSGSDLPQARSSVAQRVDADLGWVRVDTLRGLGEAYERQLAEESLLAEAEQRVVCPTCKERVQDDFILCPTCRTRLKRMCPSCAKLIRPEWNICPYCAKDFDERDWTVHAGGKAAE